jgi:hypothetical protein
MKLMQNIAIVVLLYTSSAKDAVGPRAIYTNQTRPAVPGFAESLIGVGPGAIHTNKTRAAVPSLANSLIGVGPGAIHTNKTRPAVPGFAHSLITVGPVANHTNKTTRRPLVPGFAESLGNWGGIHANGTELVVSSLRSWGQMQENETKAKSMHLDSVYNLVKSSQYEAKAKLDINQKVYIEGQPTLGDGAGQGSLNKCRAFAPQHVDSPSKPHVKVCGTGIKMTAYLLGECKEYYQHSKVIGKCQSSMAPDTCDSYSPAEDKSFGAYQSYKIEQC